MTCRREEWFASLLAGAGSVWFVYALLGEYPRLVQILPPTGGPTEVIGLAVLIWLHAKHQRVLQKRHSIFAELPSYVLPEDIL